MQKRHELKVGDYARRMAFFEWLLERNRDNQFLRNLIIGDEVGFPMNGRVNNQNVRYYAPKGNAPEFTYEVSASREKRTVWMGLCGNGSVIVPIIFERNLNGAAYLEMLKEEVKNSNSTGILTRQLCSFIQTVTGVVVSCLPFWGSFKGFDLSFTM